MICLFDLIFYVPSTIFQLNRDRSSWYEPVLCGDKCVLLKDHNAMTPRRLQPVASQFQVKHSTTETLCSIKTPCEYFRLLLLYEPRHEISNFDILISVDLDEPQQPPFKLRNSKWCSVSSLTIIEYLSHQQRL